MRLNLETLLFHEEWAMKLLAKFNLILTLLFAIGIAATAYVSRDLLQRNARDEVYEAAKLLIESALAVRGYTSQHIAPLLETQIKYEFRPEMVSAYSAIELLKNLREANPDYKQFQYREATLNPTNPVNRAVDWESDIVNAFRNGLVQPPVFGQRDTPNGRMLYVAKPLKANAACLRCHDTAELAPATMISKYGSANGFGWKVGEIIGAQIVQIPETFALARAEVTFRVFMGSLLGVLIAVAVTLNLLLWWMFIRPITKISALADRISLGEVDAPDFPARGGDEIGMLANALTRMRRSLVQAMNMLGA
jgi:protein-histidine pros-kinase